MRFVILSLTIIGLMVLATPSVAFVGDGVKNVFDTCEKKYRELIKVYEDAKRLNSSIPADIKKKYDYFAEDTPDFKAMRRRFEDRKSKLLTLYKESLKNFAEGEDGYMVSDGSTKLLSEENKDREILFEYCRILLDQIQLPKLKQLVGDVNRGGEAIVKQAMLKSVNNENKQKTPFRKLIDQVDPSDLKIIKMDCKKEWGSNFEMVKNCIQTQCEAWVELNQ